MQAPAQLKWSEETLKTTVRFCTRDLKYQHKKYKEELIKLACKYDSIK